MIDPHINTAPLLRALAKLVERLTAGNSAGLLRAALQKTGGAFEVTPQDSAQVLVSAATTLRLAEATGYIQDSQQLYGFSPLCDAVLHAVTKHRSVLADIDHAVAQICHQLKPQPALPAENQARAKQVNASQLWLHLYEWLLHKQQPGRRKQHGVYYTPRAVVRFMVRQVHQRLQHEFELPLGLAATLSWGEAAARYGFEPPQQIPPDAHFLQILDPAAGTGAFVVETIETIHATMLQQYADRGVSADEACRQWSQYVSQQLLPRLHAWELMPTACALLHLHVALKLTATGWKADPAATVTHDATHAGQRLKCGDTLLQSDTAASLTPVAILGNPPFARQSQHLGPQYDYLLKPLRQFCGSRIREPGAIIFERDINNDYAKFLSYARWCAGRTPALVASLITPASYLDGRNFRGLRETLLQAFPSVAITHLNGDRRSAPLTKNTTANGVAPLTVEQPDRDANVFAVDAGVCIATLHHGPTASGRRQVEYAGIRGGSSYKFAALNDPAHQWNSVKFTPDVSRQLSFVPHRGEACSSYDAFTPLGEVFLQSVDGLKTSRDGLLIGLTRQECLQKMQQFLRCKTANAVARQFRISVATWDWRQAQQHVAATLDQQRIKRVAYRPFDLRYLYYDPQLVFSDRRQGMSHLLAAAEHTSGNAGGGNFALVCASRLADYGFQHSLAASCLVEMKYASHNTNSRVHAALQFDADAGGWRSNISPAFASRCGRGLNTVADARDITAYALAVLHSTGYCQRYEHELKNNMPRIPAPATAAVFNRLVAVGHQLVDAYQLRGEAVAQPVDNGDAVNPAASFLAPRWSNGRVHISGGLSLATASDTFEFRSAGYQVLRSWFSAGIRSGIQRKGRKCSAAIYQNFQQVLAAVQTVQQLKQRATETVSNAGGCKGAFMCGDK